MNFISLFAGAGGIDLGLERAGMNCVAQIEIVESARQVLANHWPNVDRSILDVRKAGRKNLPPADLICGGPPCQPHSIAGDRRASLDERDLWPEFYRIIRETLPRWVLVENVPGLLSSENGRYYRNLLVDLAEVGYDAEWRIIPASSFGAPHRRSRVFIVAYSDKTGLAERGDELFQSQKENSEKGSSWEAFGFTNLVESLHKTPHKNGTGEPPFLRKNHGVSGRVDRIKMMGNAVVPQVAEWIGKRIMEVNASL